MTLPMNTQKFLEHLAKLRAEGKLCTRCDSKLRQPDGNIYCFDCMCDLEEKDAQSRDIN